MTGNDVDAVLSASLNGSRGADQQRIAQVGMGWVELVLQKNWNYGGSVWKEPLLAPGMPVRSAILVRMSDKVSRIAELSGGKEDEVGESLDDTIRDLGAYCLLYLARPISDNVSEKE